MAYNHKKRCSTLLVINKMHIKTSMKYHFTLARMAIILKTKQMWIINIGEDVEKPQPLYTVFENMKGVTTVENWLAGF